MLLVQRKKTGFYVCLYRFSRIKQMWSLRRVDSILHIFILLIIYKLPSVKAQVPLDICGKGRPCNQTCYEDWRSQAYTGKLYSNPDFWMYQGVAFFELSKGLALDLAASRCARKFENLIKFRAGRSGPGDEGQAQSRDRDNPDPRGPEFPQTVKAPLIGLARNGGWTVNEQDAFSRAMCTDVCQESDILHNQAIEYSGCTCLQLSTPESADSFTVLGDWCKRNSARLLCDILGQCGMWECTLEDFMCPRLEYNRKNIPYKGYGDCISASARRFNAKESLLWTVLMFVISFILFLH